MGVLHVCTGLFGLPSGRRDILPAVLIFDIIRRQALCLLGNPGGIRTEIGDHTHSAVPFDIDSFIQLLSQTHGFLSGKIQRLCRLLLQRTGGKGQRGFFHPFSLPDILHTVLHVFQLFFDLFQLVSRADNHLLLFFSVKLRSQRLFASVHEEIRLQRPVFLRNKGIDLFLSVADNPQSHRLYTAGA